MFMFMAFVFLPCHVLEALASKKKSKSRKEPKPAKPQGKTFIHHQTFLFCYEFVISTVGPLFPVCSSIMFLYIVTAAEEDSDDMFKPPKMDDDDDFSPFGGKSGLFSGGRGLFDDDDEVQ